MFFLFQMFYSFESFLTPGIIYRVDLSEEDIEPKVQDCSVLYFNLVASVVLPCTGSICHFW